MKKEFMTALLSTLLIGCNGEASLNGGEKESRPIRVETINVSSSNHSSSREYIGVVEERNTANLSFAVSGTVLKIFVSEGDRVVKGQLLMQLSAPNIEEALTAAKSTYEQALDGFGRAEKLYDNKSMPELDFIDAKTKLQQAKSGLMIAQKNVEYTSLTAPYSGVIGKRIATVGEVIIPTMPVMTLLEADNVVVKIAVPEGEISSLKVGDKATINVAALDNIIFAGQVLSHGIISDPISHTYEAMVSVENKSRKLLPGMIARLSIESESDGVISIPNNAVVLGRGTERFVWIVKDGKALRKEVVIDGLSSNGVVVSSGLTQGDEVIISGYQKVSTDSKVEVVR